ncbi:hypothetical protein C8R45DRAFT_940043 [Mycena sanguinolenta]|nr:hypothetical protein C8R45DRAFT_940043 [Mycena sanguinolenta]
MKISSAFVLLASVTTTAWAAVNGPCTSGPGVCISTSSCHAGGGVSTTGLCPHDPDDIKCCTKAPCSPYAGEGGAGGQCQFTSTCTGNHYTLTGRFLPGSVEFQVLSALCSGKTRRRGFKYAPGFLRPSNDPNKPKDWRFNVETRRHLTVVI